MIEHAKSLPSWPTLAARLERLTQAIETLTARVEALEQECEPAHVRTDPALRRGDRPHWRQRCYASGLGERTHTWLRCLPPNGSTPCSRLRSISPWSVRPRSATSTSMGAFTP